MSLTQAEMLGLTLAAALLSTATYWFGRRTRRRSERDRLALGDALAASEAVSAALSEEALYLSAVLSSVDAVIVLFDRTGRVRFVNERFDDVLGVRGSDLIGRTRRQFIELLTPRFEDAGPFRSVSEADEDERSTLHPTRHSGVPAEDEVELKTTEPDRRVLLFSENPVLQGDSRIGMLAVFRDVTGQRAAEEARERLLAELSARATTDALTGLKNRRAGADALASEVERARRYNRPLSIALFDLDHFKSVNDDFGHEAGDDVLRAFARVLERTARSTDVVARWGGEEFLAIVQEADLDAARVFAERVRAGLAEANPLAEILDDRPAAVRPVTCSAGVTSLHVDDDQDTLVRRSDAALYEAKHEGRDRVCTHA